MFLLQRSEFSFANSRDQCQQEFRVSCSKLRRTDISYCLSSGTCHSRFATEMGFLFRAAIVFCSNKSHLLFKNIHSSHKSKRGKDACLIKLISHLWIKMLKTNVKELHKCQQWKVSYVSVKTYQCVLLMLLQSTGYYISLRGHKTVWCIYSLKN